LASGFLASSPFFSFSSLEAFCSSLWWIVAERFIALFGALIDEAELLSGELNASPFDPCRRAAFLGLLSFSGGLVGGGFAVSSGTPSVVSASEVSSSNAACESICDAVEASNVLVVEASEEFFKSEGNFKGLHIF
jgi:hypothetical protein